MNYHAGSYEMPTNGCIPSQNDHWAFHVTNKTSRLQPAH